MAAQQSLWLHAQQLIVPWLSAQEIERWQSLSNSERKQEFLACRYGLRAVLTTPHASITAWALSAQAGHAPHVIHSPDAGVGCKEGVGISLSLSHSQNYVVCASAPWDLGVDLEVLPFKRSRNVLEMARMVCSPTEAQLLSQLDASQQTQNFVNYWVLKEAFFKCRGTGLDFQSIRQITCVQREQSSISGAAIAHAWLWQGANGLGKQLIWAVCCLHPIHKEDISLASEIAAQPPQAWTLVQQG